MKTIGKYQILGEVGSSATGKTYRARDAVRKIEVALKALDSSSSVTTELKNEFCRDLAACAELRHPNLAKTQDVGEVEVSLYIATELLAGADLQWARLDKAKEGPQGANLWITEYLYWKSPL